MTPNEYLLGGLINIIDQRYVSIIESNKVEIGRLRNFIALQVICYGKWLEIINLCRILMSLESEGVYSSLAKY